MFNWKLVNIFVVIVLSLPFNSKQKFMKWLFIDNFCNICNICVKVLSNYMPIVCLFVLFLLPLCYLSFFDLPLSYLQTLLICVVSSHGVDGPHLVHIHNYIRHTIPQSNRTTACTCNVKMSLSNEENLNIPSSKPLEEINY
jgi:hypothetical protein